MSEPLNNSETKSTTEVSHRSVDITLTDFIYGIVAGSAFQNIKQPTDSVGNLIIFIALVILIDDWVLYHAQSKEITHTPNQFAKVLFMDATVLFTWFLATTYNAADISLSIAVEGFLFWILVFYIFTCAWELVFLHQTEEPARIHSDFFTILLLFLCYLKRDIIIQAGIYIPIIAAWLLIRSYAWIKILKPDIISWNSFCTSIRECIKPKTNPIDNNATESRKN